MSEYKERIVMVGAGVANITAAYKLVSNGCPGELITLIDKGKDPYNRPENEVMHGFAGAGLKSDGKVSYLTNAVGGQLSKYCGEEKAQQLVDESMDIIRYFHPDPTQIKFSNPKDEPEFIKPYFNLRMAPTYHIGSDYLLEIGKNWYDYLVGHGVKFEWEREVVDIDFNENLIHHYSLNSREFTGPFPIHFDKLIYGTGKSGIDLTQKLIDSYNLKKEPKSVQVGFRMELPQHYLQSIIDIAYDYKLYKKISDKVSIRTFCSNSGAAYVAEEDTYGMKSYNGHSYSNSELNSGLTNFGVIMEIKSIEHPFEFQKQLVAKCNINGKGLHYSPNYTRKPSLSSKEESMNLVELDNLDIFKEAYGEYAQYFIDFIDDLNKVFNFSNDFSLYIPEVKFLSEEVLVSYSDLSLIDYPNIHFIGDSLSARGIAVSMAQSLLAVENLIK